MACLLPSFLLPPCLPSSSNKCALFCCVSADISFLLNALPSMITIQNHSEPARHQTQALGFPSLVNMGMPGGLVHSHLAEIKDPLFPIALMIRIGAVLVVVR